MCKFCLQPAEAGFVCVAAVSNRRGCRDFNRRDIFNPRRRVLSVPPRFPTAGAVSPRFQSPRHLQPAEAGFVCVAAVSNRRGSVAAVSNRRGCVAAISIAETSSTRGGGFCLCRRGFQPPGHLKITIALKSYTPH